MTYAANRAVGINEPSAPTPSGNERYDRNEGERAQHDLMCRAIQYANDCGAAVQWPPPGKLESILQSEFWFVIYNAGVHRHAFEGPAHRVEDNKRKLTEVVKAMVPLVELLRDEPHTRALGALSFENWLVKVHSENQPFDGGQVAERMHQCIELLLGPLEHAFERAKGSKTLAHTDRGKLIRWALEQGESSGGWWPSNPTDEDLTVLSILTGVFLDNFEDDFDNRVELAVGTGATPEPTHLEGLWRRERKRWGDLRKALE
jgi:hypothetical protein